MHKLFVFNLFSAALLVSTLAAQPAAPPSNPVHLTFKTAGKSLLVLPVTVNGAGPFRLVLDTGTTRTAIASSLAAKLSLPHLRSVTSVCVTRELSLTIVQTASISLSGASVDGLEVSVLPSTTALPGGVDGILGEDFLEHFDILVDNRQHVLDLAPRNSSAATSLAESLRGERVPVALEGILDGGRVLHQLIVQATSPQLRPSRVSLLLDSGSNSLVLFGGPAALAPVAQKQTINLSAIVDSSFTTASILILQQLQVGASTLRAVSVTAPAGVAHEDADGVLPTNIFRSIFISHSGAYILLNPEVGPASLGLTAK